MYAVRVSWGDDSYQFPLFVYRSAAIESVMYVFGIGARTE